MDKPSATEAAPGPEPILDPGRRILDPHHHLWPAGAGPAYLLDELRADTGDGHRVEATVFVECMTGYLTDGPEALRRAGETAFVARAARESRDGKGARIAAKSGVIKDVPPGETWSGFPARPHREEMRRAGAAARLPRIIAALERLVGGEVAS